jgi:Co/Zn/Cd efflux system component
MGILLVLRSPTAASAAIILASLLTWASDSMWPDTVVAIYILWMNASAAQSILYAAERPASSNR